MTGRLWIEITGPYASEGGALTLRGWWDGQDVVADLRLARVVDHYAVASIVHGLEADGRTVEHLGFTASNHSPSYRRGPSKESHRA